MDIVAVLQLIRPKAQYVVYGNSYEGLTWNDTNQAKPTEAEISQGWEDLEKLAYKEKRAKEYPPIGDQLDLIIKTFEHLSLQTIDIGQDGMTLVTLSNQIKEKYPK